MAIKYSNRSVPSVQRAGSYPEQDENNNMWYERFVNNLQKYHVTEAQGSIYDDISAILNNTKSKHSSVEEAVLDMQERTGLRQYLQQKEALAFIQGPEIFQKIPQMKIFIDNFIQDRPGTSVESVVHDLLTISDIRDALENRSDVDDEVRDYINKKIVDVKSNMPDQNKVDMNFGKVDQSPNEMSNDPLAICEPAKNT